MCTLFILIIIFVMDYLVCEGYFSPVSYLFKITYVLFRSSLKRIAVSYINAHCSGKLVYLVHESNVFSPMSISDC